VQTLEPTRDGEVGMSCTTFFLNNMVTHPVVLKYGHWVRIEILF